MGEAWNKRGYRTSCPDYGSGLVLPPVGLKQNSLRIPIFECRGRSGLGSADMSALLESLELVPSVASLGELAFHRNYLFFGTHALPRTVRPCWSRIVFS